MRPGATTFDEKEISASAQMCLRLGGSVRLAPCGHSFCRNPAWFKGHGLTGDALGNRCSDVGGFGGERKLRAGLRNVVHAGGPY
jgi:hypothetical protein